MSLAYSADTDTEKAVTRWYDADMSIHRLFSGLFLLGTARASQTK